MSRLKKHCNLEKKRFVSLLCIKRKRKTYVETSPTWESERGKARESVRVRMRWNAWEGEGEWSNVHALPFPFDLDFFSVNNIM